MYNNVALSNLLVIFMQQCCTFDPHLLVIILMTYDYPRMYRKIIINTILMCFRSSLSEPVEPGAMPVEKQFLEELTIKEAQKG